MTDAELSKIEITPEYTQALTLIDSGYPVIYVTGKAGTGKSTLLHYFASITTKQLAIVAPTGLAAVNVGGQSIHSFFRFPPTVIQHNDIKDLRYTGYPHPVKGVDVIAIDEVSMVRSDIMEGIDWFLRKNRDASLPFGGVQLILFGDLAQLPPIVSDRSVKTYLDEVFGGKYFFNAPCISQLKPPIIELTKIYRQKDEDFIGILNDLRSSKVSKQSQQLLASRVMNLPDFGKACAEAPYIVLSPTNKEVSQINKERLSALSTQPFTYSALVKGDFNYKNCPAEASLTLKEGAQVMLIKNDQMGRWVNGTLATVSKLTDSKIYVEINGTNYLVEQAEWESVKYSYNSSEKRVGKNVTGALRQFPIKLAWAVTIHKSQGQSFDNVFIELTRMFSHGQLYVALSRCRSLSGLGLSRPLSGKDFILDSGLTESQKILRTDYKACLSEWSEQRERLLIAGGSKQEEQEETDDNLP